MRDAGSSPRGFEIIGYHCSRDEEEIKSILKSGYWVNPPSLIYFENFLNELSAMLPSDEQDRLDRKLKRVKLAEEKGDLRLAQRLWDKSVEDLQHMWTARFPGGLVWVGPHAIRDVYGPYCVEITLPPEATLIVEDETGGEGYYVEKNVPPSRIRPA